MSKGRPKGRSLKTYQNKLQKMKSFYSKTFRNSQKQKQANEKTGYKKTSYFCDKNPDESSFLKKLNLKGTNAKGEK